MLWKYYIPTVWENHSKKSEWRNIYIFNMEQSRNVNSPSHDIDITAYWTEGIRLYGNLPEVEKDLKEYGYSVDQENLEIFIPDPFDFEECLETLKISIQEIYNDDSPDLIQGQEEDFAGTNRDSVATMIARDQIKKIQKTARDETEGDLWKYLRSHPDEFIHFK